MLAEVAVAEVAAVAVFAAAHYEAAVPEQVALGAPWLVALD